MFLVATTLEHALFGVFGGTEMYDHHNAMVHPWLWAFLHGVAVLFAATVQVVGWRLSEAEERRAEENLNESKAQLSVAFDETPVPMAMIAPDGRILRTNSAYRAWLGLPGTLPPGFAVADLPLTALDTDREPMFDVLLGSSADTAMYAAERAGGNRVEVFSDQMRITVRRRVVSEARLREALDGPSRAWAYAWPWTTSAPGTAR